MAIRNTSERNRENDLTPAQREYLEEIKSLKDQLTELKEVSEQLRPNNEKSDEEHKK